MASPAFWDDNRRAQELIRERSELARVVARVTELGGQASDLAVLLELAAEAGDDSVAAAIPEGTAKLAFELDAVELKGMPPGPAGPEAALPSIPPRAGRPQAPAP